MKKTVIQPHKSSLGMDANITSLLIFIAMIVVAWIPFLGWLSWAVPLVVFFMEKESKFVKFQAVTAFVLSVIGAAISIVMQVFTWILTPRDLYKLYGYALSGRWGLWTLFSTVSTIASLILTAITIYLIVMAYGYNQVELPIIGPIVAKVSEKLAAVNLNQTTGNVPNNNANTQQAESAPSSGICPSCGKQHPPGTKFCIGCGTKL